MNYILQDLQGFTVQIYDNNKSKLHGTGFVVATDGIVVKILTAAHVLRDIFHKHPRETIDISIYIKFPLIQNIEDCFQEARVIACFHEYDDDIVMLQLLGKDPRPISDQNFAKFGNIEESYNNRFISFGYPPVSHYYPEGVTDGIIIGPYKNTKSGTFVTDLIRLKTEKSSMKIVGSMSGAPILDKHRNLVVGMILGYYTRKKGSKEDFAYGINCKAFTYRPFNLDLESANLALESGPRNRFDIEQDKLIYRENPGKSLYGAPESLSYWAGRDDYLKQLDSDWNNPHCHVTSLIGFGGEGKSSLARRWVDKLEISPQQPQPQGVFWWNFYDNRSIDGFLTAIIRFLSDDKDLLKIPSPDMKIAYIIRILSENSYLFILDGLEVMQYQAGSSYGKIESGNLRNFIKHFASINSFSLCLITSRVQLFDLLNYTSHHKLEVNELNISDGRTLLKNLGIIAPDIELDRIINYWNGHALSLTLVGKYIIERASYSGYDDDNRPESQDEDRYHKIHRILRRYDQFLTFEEKMFMQLISAFQIPVGEIAFQKVFRNPGTYLSDSISRLGNDEFYEMIKNLEHRGLVRQTIYNLEKVKGKKAPKKSNKINIGTYEVHPLIRQYYYDQLSENIKPSINLSLAKYSHSLYKPRRHKNLEVIQPLMDEVYYLCEAKHYDDAFTIFRTQIDPITEYDESCKEDNVGFLIYKVGAETELSLLRQFFNNRDLSQEPKITSIKERAFLLESIGLDLSYLGESRTAVIIDERASRLAVKCKDWIIATWANQNISDDYAKIGNLSAGIEVCKKTIKMAEKTEEKLEEQSSAYIRMGYIHFLLGEIKKADASFKKANELRPENDPDPIPWLWSYGEGIWYSFYLARTGQLRQASIVTKANLSLSSSEGDQDSIIGCFRILGDIYRFQEKYHTAMRFYSKAVDAASKYRFGEELVLSYLGRGLTYLAIQEMNASQSDLEQALYASTSYGYRVWELDVRIARVKFAFQQYGITNKEISSLEQEINKVLSSTKEIGYKWVEGDSFQLLGEIAIKNNNRQNSLEYLTQARDIRYKIRDVRLAETEKILRMMFGKNS